MKKVSVVTTTLGAATYIEDQFKSFADQTLIPAEVFVVDDGSSDSIVHIVSALALKAPFPIRVIAIDQNQNDAYLTALSECSGDFIAPCGPGDVWLPEKLERCVDALDQTNALVCAHTATLVGERNEYVGFLSQGIRNSGAHAPRSLPPFKGFRDGTFVFRRELAALLKQLSVPVPPRDIRGDDWIYFLGHALGVTVTLSHPLARCRPEDLSLDRADHPGEALVRRRLLAEARLLVMTQLSLASARVALPENAAAAANYWRRMTDICALRETLYSNSRFTERRAALDRLRSLGIYRTDDSEHVGANLTKDTLVGLLRMTQPFALSRSGRTRLQTDTTRGRTMNEDQSRLTK